MESSTGILGGVLMKVLVAIVMGLFSGLLIYFGSALLFADLKSSSTEPSGLFVAVTFLGGWILTTYLILKGAKSLSCQAPENRSRFRVINC